MPALIGPTSPFAYAHFHMRGGGKAMLVSVVGINLALAALIVLTTRINQRHATSAYSGWVVACLALQALALMLAGTSRIATSIRDDFKTGMMDSHRAMPTGSACVIWGYIFGTPIFSLAVYASLWIPGFICTLAAQLPPIRWIAPSLFILMASAVVWVLTTYVAFNSRFGGGAFGLMFIPAFVGPMLALIVPALSVIANRPLLSGILNPRANSISITSEVLVCVIFEVVLAALFFIGAMRKYRRPDLPSLRMDLSLALTTIWVLASVLAVFDGSVTKDFWGQPTENVPAYGALASSLLVCLVPLITAARNAVQARRTGLSTPGSFWIAPLICSSLMIPLIFGLWWGASDPAIRPAFLVSYAKADPLKAVLCAYATVVGFCLSMLFMARLAHRLTDKVGWIIVLWVLLTCLLPWAVDATISAYSLDEEFRAHVAVYTPVGNWIRCFANLKGWSPVPGAIFQLFLFVLPLSLERGIARRQLAGGAIEGNIATLPPLQSPA